MTKQEISLTDRFDLSKETVLLNGTQALVRLVLAQKERDRAAGLNTAGYVTGYRGSPLGAVDLQMERASKHLAASDVVFQAGLNEDLAATALWGVQQAEMFGEGKFDGVYGLWYGKGPGVDRSGDVFRHANMAGTSENGGVLVCMGDDHTGESSTVLHQSEFALVDAMMPILSPAGVQEVLDYGAYGYALSRYSGCWVGLKCVKDTIEATAVVDGDPSRVSVNIPTDFAMPADGINIRADDSPVAQEARLHDYKRFAAEAFARANNLDKRMAGKPGAKIGIVSSGKNWLDTQHALDLLGLDDAELERLGITTYKVAMVWPLDMTSFHEWAEGLDMIIVVEEKRKLIEVQIKEAIFDDRNARRVIGWKHDIRKDEVIFTVKGALEPITVARKIGMLLGEEGRSTDGIKEALMRLDEATAGDNAEEIAARTPWFCSGCPHNSSTKVPDGSRAYAGIGCHYMAKWMDRDTMGFTHMGAEGANWIGESLFSTRDHVFQNLGDGTYNHSGVQAIRAALAANTNITYKILFNDAVAMTGGQHNEGELSAARICAEIQSMGLKNIFLVYDEKEEIDFSEFPSGIEKFERADLPLVQEKCTKIKGVSAIVYVQTCAAEKRRRRKRGLFPDPDQRVFINPAVCEGCGDCGVQSNCVSVVPLETELGRKRAIDQSSCNKDFSCVNGFCPSFVTVKGGTPKKQAASGMELPALTDPVLPTINGTHNLVITGVGGTGVVTVGAVLAMAAHVEGKGAGMMEMAGLAQKGGAVHIHCRLAEKPSDISAVRVAIGEAHGVIGGDLVVTAGAKTLGLMGRGRTKVVCNSHEIVTGDFTRNAEFSLPSDRLQLSLTGRLGEEAVSFFDATELARVHLGDSIYANMLMVGAAWQNGLIPLSEDSIMKAIELNGAGVEGNKRAFAVGRWAVSHPAEAAKSLVSIVVELPKSFDERISYRADLLKAYQNAALAQKYRDFVATVDNADLREAVAKSYYKLLAYKDEYEVARLHADHVESMVAESFDNVKSLEFHLAPPILPGKTADGRPKKRKFGAWILPVFNLLKKGKVLRGTPFDPFGYSAERKMERALIAEYERDMKEVLPLDAPATRDLIKALAELPMQIRGFGPVKQQNVTTVGKRREELLAMIRAGGTTHSAAAE
ncbi:indolepyruvate ferredoxin oxidoreductase family protein [Neptunicoccus cionae]|uniref:indolepyruvate ferredoxin oxidoreductase family protein n=1 Tax=Neptunicoccus cionae TaxID=2035344 RepID=UPI000C76051C|nr:indolepyruvate ferredoxin oxidoreductase family protein [Amylibacter cionae]PLS20762.1 indolepyruvate ferredoxin oxidoreductase [Amylibacter cionae]